MILVKIIKLIIKIKKKSRKKVSLIRVNYHKFLGNFVMHLEKFNQFCILYSNGDFNYYNLNYI